MVRVVTYLRCKLRMLSLRQPSVVPRASSSLTLLQKVKVAISVLIHEKMDLSKVNKHTKHLLLVIFWLRPFLRCFNMPTQGHSASSPVVLTSGTESDDDCVIQPSV